MSGSTVIIALPTTDASWVTGAEVVKRDSAGQPTVVRLPTGTLHTTFTVL